MSLGAVVIGWNQAWNLRVLAEILSTYPFDEIVYVDSNSNDSSVAIAQSAGWRTAILSPEGVLSAAAGRHVGTIVCKAD